MAVDFDFDTSFNDDDEGNGNDNDNDNDNENAIPEESEEPFEFDDEQPVEEVAEEEEEAPQQRGSSRLILLVIIILVLLCVFCFLGYRFLPPGLIPGFGGAPPTDIPAQDTPTLAATDDGTPSGAETPDATSEVPGEGTPDATSEVPGEGTPDATSEVPGEGTPDATSEVPGEGTPDATSEVPGEGTPDATSEVPGEGTPDATATTEPVPGPTSTPGPTVVITIEPSCDQNQPPVADANGPYDGMQGKGQAIITFDGSDSSDLDGTIESYEWDFGDGSDPESGETVVHGYKETGAFVATLTVTDNCGESTQDTSDVTVVGPTPPASEEEDESDEADDSKDSADAGASGKADTVTQAAVGRSISGTVGFCHPVQYGDTLSGIAAQYGVPLQALAEVNGVGLNYYVIAGQGLFVPVDEVREGPNIYQVQPEDTLNSIAFQCGLSTATLAQVNGIGVDQGLTPQQTVVIPPWRF